LNQADLLNKNVGEKILFGLLAMPKPKMRKEVPNWSLLSLV
jgi:hypothetical protein